MTLGVQIGGVQPAVPAAVERGGVSDLAGQNAHDRSMQRSLHAI
jgi:hypothetical protein